MNRREPDLLRVGTGVALRLRIKVGQQCDFTEEFRGGVVLSGEPGNLLEILEPRVVVRELVLKIILVTSGNDHADEVSRPLGLFFLQLVKRLGELFPAKRGLLRRLAGDVAQRLAQAWLLRDLLGQARSKRCPKLGRRLGSNARQHQHDALERQFVGGIDEELQVSGDVLDVGLLKKPDAAREHERNVAPRELELQFERVKVRAVQHGDSLHRHALVTQFEHALGDELRLLVGVVTGDERRLHARVAHRREHFLELLRIRGDDGVGAVENLRCAAVVCLDLEHLGAVVPVGELEHVAEVGATPRVDALRVVADRHDVVVPTAEQVDQLALHLVRVLVFIHEDELEPRLERLARLAVFA